MNNRPSGSIPRKTTINDQPHMLAYINPQEAMMLKSMGGTGQPGPGGIPAFAYGIGGQGAVADNFGYSQEGPGESPGDKAARQAANSAVAQQQAKDAMAANAQAAATNQNVRTITGGFTPAVDIAKNNQATQDAALLDAYENKINNPVKQKGILGLLSKFSPFSMLGKYAVKNQNLSALSQLKDPNQKVERSFLGNLLSGNKAKTHSHYSPVKDNNGNIVGSQAIADDGTTIGYYGQRTGSLSGSQGDVQGYVDAMNAAGQGGPEGPSEPLFQTTDSTDGTETTPITTTPTTDDFLIKNLAIQQPGTTTGFEVPSIYNQGGVVSLDPFKQLRNRM